jgi:ABC-2 type transport system permease protein
MWRAIFKKELLTVIRSPWYWLSCIVSPLLALFLILGGPRLLNHFTSQSWRIAYHVQGSALWAEVIGDAKAKIPHMEWTELVAPPGPAERMRVRSDQLDAILTLSGTELATGHAELLTRNLGQASKTKAVRDALSDVVVQRQLSARGLTRADVDRLLAPFSVEVQQLGAEERRHGDQAIWIAYGMIAVVFLMVLAFGATVMNAMCKEKTTKMIEVILSCTTAEDLVLGKVVGICSSALLQVVVWVAVGLIEFQAATWLLGASGAAAADVAAKNGGLLAQAVAFPTLLWVLCGLFLVLGLALFVLFYAAVGSMVDTPEDAQHLLLPISAAWEVPLFLSFVVKEVPDSALSVIASMIPPFAPFLMPMRLTLTAVPGWQVGLSLLLLVAGIWGGHRLTAKIYRVGLLMTGKPPTLRQVWRWFRLA